MIEHTYRGDRIITSPILVSLRKFIRKVFMREQFIKIIIPSDLDYNEQIVYLIKQVFKEVLPIDKCLGIDFRDTLINYYAYKFAMESKMSRDVIDLLERDFQNSKYRDIVMKLDSKELEERITLNPPPEISPLLDRVIISILDIKNRELERVKNISDIEKTRSMVEKLLMLLSKGYIAVLFIGKRKPENYLSYIRDRIEGFRGLLLCARGRYIMVLESMYDNIIEILKEHFGEVIEERIEGVLERDGEKVRHCYIFILNKELEEQFV
ncbi:MAG: hypothetical protein B6U89_01555 [Desulfurococcales archaeon ex4484_58]|nr:MAG: hypothetical protein B6U89_01555 [Desulfurococcales archaeon ex4484_58]